MAKKDKAAKAGRIPKRIAGIKLPKDLRKSGERLIEKAGSPEGRRVIAAGMAMAGAAMARAKTPPPVPPVPPVPPKAGQAGKGATPPVPPVHPTPDGLGAPMIDPTQIAEAVGQAATAFFDGLFGRRR